MTIKANNPYRGRDIQIQATHQALAVVPDDANDLVVVCRGVIVTTAGILKCTFVDDTVPVLVPVQPGFTYKFLLSRIWATGTTCGNVIALY